MPHANFLPVISHSAKHGYIPGLDGMRAFAVLLVIVAHMGYSHILPGGLGVTLFFFISGFLITRLLLAERTITDRINLGQFYIRRFIRLLPALLFMVALSLVAMWGGGERAKPIEVVAAVTYTSNYLYGHNAFTGASWGAPWSHLWSLAVEEHFYLLFPLLIAFFSPRRAFYTALIGCGLALMLRIAYVVIWDMPADYIYAATETRLDSILWGCILSLGLHVPDVRRRMLKAVGWSPLVIALGVQLFCLAYRGPEFRMTLRYTLQGVSFLIIFLNVFNLRDLRSAIAVLEFGPLKWIGSISYALYLWHVPALHFVETSFGYGDRSLGLWLVGGGLIFACATLSWYGVERPMIGLRRRFGSRAIESNLQVRPAKV